MTNATLARYLSVMTDSTFAELPCRDLLSEFLVEGGLRVTNPADGRFLAAVPDMADHTIADAIARAEAALPEWRERTAKERADILKRWNALILARVDDLAALMTAEQGKILSEARTEVAYAAGFIEWFAEEGRRIYGETIPAHGPDKRIMVLRQPVGVVATITPWNFPLAMITRKVGPALAAGCTVVAKPAEATPLSAYALAALAYQAGLPRDCFSIVTANDAPRVGRQLCASETIRKLSFTGSTAVGKTLMEWCAPTVKRLSLELGGNAPLIVFEDADLDVAVKGAVAAKFRNAGQTCVCANRVLVADAVYDAFIQKFADAVGRMKVGPGTEPGVDIGPLIDGKAVEKVRAIAQDAQDKGGKLIGGSPAPQGGNFLMPGIIADATPDMACARDEIFGPLAPVFRFRDEAEAIALANDTRAGLAAYFFSRDIARIWRVAEALEYGMIGINEPAISTEVAPFGGIKESGLGREGSRHGIEEYLEMKYLCFGQIG